MFGVENNKESNTRYSEWNHLGQPLGRLAAHIVDFVILVPLIVLFSSVLKHQVIVTQLIGYESDLETLALFYLISSISLHVFYHTLFLSIISTTPGKYFFGISVFWIWSLEESKEPKRLFWQKAFIRSIFWWVDVFLCLPLIALISNERRRPLHDRISDGIVLTNKLEMSVSKPSSWEVGIGRGIMSMFVVLILTGSIFFLQNEYMSLKEKQSWSQWKDGEKELCREFADLSKKKALESNSIEQAIFFYVNYEINNDCLNKEADYVLWKRSVDDEELQEAYFAKFLTYRKDKVESVNYQKEVCRNNIDTFNCKFAQNLIGVDNLGFENDLKDYQKLLMVKEFFDKGLVQRSEWLIEELGQKHKKSDFLLEYKIKILWVMNKHDQVKDLLTYSYQKDEQRKLELNSWICYEELKEGCSSRKTSYSCNLVENYMSTKGRDSLDDSLQTLSFYNLNQCGFEKKITEVKVVDSSLEKYLLEISMLSEKDDELARSQFFYSIYASEKYDKFIRSDAGFRFVRSVKSKEMMQDFIKLWGKEEGHSWSWFLLGEAIFTALLNSGDERGMLAVHHSLSSWQNTLEANRQRMVKAYFKRGDFVKAHRWLLKEQSSIRGLAEVSKKDDEFDKIKMFLFKKILKQ